MITLHHANIIEKKGESIATFPIALNTRIGSTLNYLKRFIITFF